MHERIFVEWVLHVIHSHYKHPEPRSKKLGGGGGGARRLGIVSLSYVLFESLVFQDGLLAQIPGSRVHVHRTSVVPVLGPWVETEKLSRNVNLNFTWL